MRRVRGWSEKSKWKVFYCSKNIFVVRVCARVDVCVCVFESTMKGRYSSTARASASLFCECVFVCLCMRVREYIISCLVPQEHLRREVV